VDVTVEDVVVLDTPRRSYVQSEDKKRRTSDLWKFFSMFQRSNTGVSKKQSLYQLTEQVSVNEWKSKLLYRGECGEEGRRRMIDPTVSKLSSLMPRL